MRMYVLVLAVLCYIIGSPGVALCADFPYSHYEAVLAQCVKQDAMINGTSVNAVNYAVLAHESTKQDSPYSLLLKELASFTPAMLESKKEQMAFWINVYNIAAIKTIVDHYPVESIRSKKINFIGLPWSRKAIMVGGVAYSLEEIEFRKLVNEFRDLRVHFGINCASVSCVDLLDEPYRSKKLDQQLEEQGKRFLKNREKGMRIDSKRKYIYLSQIFKFDKKHFDSYAGGAVNFILPYLTEDERELLRVDNFDVKYLDYDWNTNDVKNAK